jgi:hypothetical protein
MLMAVSSNSGTESQSARSTAATLLRFFRGASRDQAPPVQAQPPQHQPVNWPPQPLPEPVAAAPAPPPRLEPKAKALLVEISLTSTRTPGFSNAHLAGLLLQCEEAVEPDSRRAIANRAIVQRIALVSRMIDAVTDDPNLTEPFKRSYERLRFSLIKSALADPNFFEHRHHPLRASAARLAFRAAMMASGDETTQQQIDELLQEAVRDYDLAAAFVNPILIRLQPLGVEVIRDFVGQLRAERAEREAARRGYELVLKEIELRIASHGPLHPRLRFIVEVEWAAVLLARLVAHGESSAQWREGLAWIDALVRQHKAIESGAPVPVALVERLEAGLREAGRSIAPAVKALLDFAPVVEPGAPAPAPEAKPEVPSETPRTLATLMQNERWFRVFDHAQERIRWLKTSRYDARTNMVAFAEMDGSNEMTMSAEQFVEDLRRGLSAPNNPDMETTLLVTALRSRLGEAAAAS